MVLEYPTADDYRKLFDKQTGQGTRTEPFYIGLPVQRGRGPGVFFRFLTRNIIPLFKQLPSFFKSDSGKQFTRSVAQHVIDTGANILKDRMTTTSEERQPFKKAIKRRVGELGENIVGEVKNIVQQQQQHQQQGEGYKKTMRKRKGCSCVKGRGGKRRQKTKNKKKTSRRRVVSRTTTGAGVGRTRRRKKKKKREPKDIYT